MTANQELIIEVQDESKNPHVDEHATTAAQRHGAMNQNLQAAGTCMAPAVPWWAWWLRINYNQPANFPVIGWNKCSRPGPHFPFPYKEPVRWSCTAAAAATIERVPKNLRNIVSRNRRNGIIAPTAVSIGPYYFSSSMLFKMDAAKQAAVEEFCRAACRSREQVHGRILSVAGDARRCYNEESDDRGCMKLSDGEFADMMLLDGCFLLQFMFSMAAPHRPGAFPESDPLMSRAEVHRRIDAIARDVLLLENQIPWLVLQVLMELRPSAVPVLHSFLALMASAFDIGNVNANSPPTLTDDDGHDDEPPPPHLLGLFHRRQMGAARTQSLRVPTLSSLSSTAVELAEMGVRLVAGKTEKFGDMAMTKRRHLFGELSLAPVVLTELTQCWLFNMAAYEACLGFTRADNFAVSSYVTLASILMNRREDVQEMRAKGLVVSAFSDEGTLNFFKWLAPHLQVGHRYYDVFKHLQEYRQERWLWIAVHRFLYNNFKTIVAVLSAVGVLAGLFKTILSLKEPHGSWVITT